MSKSPIPIEILEQHLVALGKTGSGKSSACRVLVEMLYHAKKRICIIDKKGDWYGLKLGADGKSPGLPFMAIGDFKDPKATDLHIKEGSGAEIAKLITSGNRPCIIGFRGWMPGNIHRFWIDFASTVYNTNKAPLWLVIDECHNYTPKGKVLSPQVGECIYWTNLIASEGRGIGLRLIGASQRPAKVHNDFLTSCETLVSMRVTHPSDREASADWLKEYSTDNERGKLVLGSLSKIKTGEAFVWSPESDFFEQLKFPMFETFDSFASPKEGKQRKLKGWAEVDMAEVQERLSKVIEESKANDPAILKKRIAELDRQLKQAQSVSQKPVGNKPDNKTLQALRSTNAQLKKQLEQAMKILVEITTRNFDASMPKEEIEKAVTAAVANGLKSVEMILEKRGKDIAGLKQRADQVMNSIKQITKEDVTVKLDVKHNEPYTVTPARTLPKMPVTQSRESSNGDLQKGERIILIAVCQHHPDGCDRTQLSVLTTYKRSSRDRYIYALMQKGFVDEQNGQVLATEQGMAALLWLMHIQTR